ncbi:MAG TPA: fibronectin type III domain-containing protein [Patescibacteria group bacterium]|nr:fibronectin type III domain-containing protein [Patescibacteria group bacterium]
MTVGAGGGTAQFSKASGTQTLTSGGVTIPILTHTGAGTLQLASALTATTLTNSVGILDLNGQNLSYTAAAGTINDGTITLQGNETLTNVNNLDTDSGTVTYKGRNAADTFDLKGFNYYHLTINDANVTKATYRTAAATPLVVAGAFTITAGTFDNATNDNAVTVTGDVTMDNTQTDMGDATWTVSGSFDNKDVTTFNRNLSTLVMSGGTEATPVSLIGKHGSNMLNNLTVSGYAQIPSANGGYFAVYRVITISGTIDITSAERLWPYGDTPADLYVTNTGKITGAGVLGLDGYTSIIQQDGTIDVASISIAGEHSAASSSIVPATYQSATVSISGGGATNLTWATSAGTYTFNGNVTFRGNSSSTGTYTIDNSAGANFVFKGNVTVTNGTSTLNWTKGAGSITFSKASGTQTANFLDKTVEDLIIGDGSTTNTVQLTDGVTTDDITVNSGSTLDMNSQAVSYGAATGSTNNGTIKLKGDETLTNISNLDTDSGWVEYTGTGAYATLPYTGIYYNLNFSGSGSYTLPASLDANGEFALNGSAITAPGTELTVGGNFSHTSGTFTHNSGLVTLDGASQTISGNTSFYDLTKNVTSADTLTFTAASTQTVDNTLDLQGVSGSSLSLRSSNDNNAWNIVHSGTAGTYTTSYLDVKDSNHTGGSDFVALSSTGVSGNTGWVFPTYYTIVSSASSTTPGTPVTATLTMKDTNGATVAATGDYTFTFSGASTSTNGYIPTATDKNGTAVQFGSATVITLTNGIGTTSITPYKTESSSITATDTNTLSTTTPLSFTVASPTAAISITDSSTKSYFTSPAISVTLTIANTSGTSGATYKLAEDSAGVSSATSHTLSANPYSTGFTLTSSDGYHTVYGAITDAYGNVTSIVSSPTITLDTTAPSVVSGLQALNSSDNLASEKVFATTLLFTPSTDATAGIKGYIITKSFDSAQDANADGTTLEPTDSIVNASTVTLTEPLTVQTTKDTAGKQYSYYIDITNKENTKYTYAIRAMDNAGNLGTALAIDETGKITRPSISTLTKVSDLKVEFKQQSGSGASKSKDTPTLVAIVTFTTDAPATGSVNYGSSRDSLSSTAKGTDKEAGAFNTSHTFTIDGLQPQTTYFFAASATDQNKRQATALASQTSPSIEDKQSIFELIWDRISGFFTTIWQAARHFFREGFSMGSPTRALAAESAIIKELHAVKTYDKNNKYVGNAVYWPAGAASYNLKRDGTAIAAPTTNRYIDLTAQEANQYRYAADAIQGGIVDAIPGGNPNITELKAKSIAITQTGASVEVSWLTQGVASSSKVRYGTTQGAYTQEQAKDSLDEAHKVIVNGLDPAKTYFFQVLSTSNSQQTVTSDEISYNVPESEKVKSIIVIIYEALMRAFGALAKWINTK